MGKRLFDLFFAVGGLLLMGLPMLLIALWVRLDSPGPALFRQERIGRGGVPFRICKFRTMLQDAPLLGPGISAAGDPRITRAGQWLRRSKLDELPQFFDVLRGRMSVVGPRPELARYVALYPADLRDQVLSVRPGMTDPVSLKFADESDLLGAADDPEREYRERILPAKLRASAAYVAQATLGSDLRVLGQTLALLVRR